MVDYVKLRETYESYGCKLLSTEEEVNKLMEVKKKSIEYQKLRFESKCGHESEGYLVNLKYKGTGMNCRKCAYKCISVKAKGKDDKEIGFISMGLCLYALRRIKIVRAKGKDADD